MNVSIHTLCVFYCDVMLPHRTCSTTQLLVDQVSILMEERMRFMSVALVTQTGESSVM